MAKKVFDQATTKWVLPEDLTSKEKPKDITDPIEIANLQLRISNNQLKLTREQLKVAKSTNTLVIFIAIPFIIAMVIVIISLMFGGLTL